MKKDKTNLNQKKMLSIQTNYLEYLGIDNIQNNDIGRTKKSNSYHSFVDDETQIKYVYLKFRLYSNSIKANRLLKVAYPYHSVPKRRQINSELQNAKSTLKKFRKIHVYINQKVKENNSITKKELLDDNERLSSVLTKTKERVNKYYYYSKKEKKFVLKKDLMEKNLEYPFKVNHFYKMNLNVDHFAKKHEKGYIFFYNNIVHKVDSKEFSKKETFIKREADFLLDKSKNALLKYSTSEYLKIPVLFTGYDGKNFMFRLPHQFFKKNDSFNELYFDFGKESIVLLELITSWIKDNVKYELRLLI